MVNMAVELDQLLLVLFSAVVNGVVIAVAMYIGFRKGLEKAVDIIVERMRKRVEESPTASKVVKAIEASDRLFGDGQVVEQMTRFFKSAADLLSSQEARRFFEVLGKLLSPPPSKKELRKIDKA